MLKSYEDKRHKGQGNVFPSGSLTKKDHNQNSDGNTLEIRNHKAKDIIFFFDYYKVINGTKDNKRIEIISEKNNRRIFGCNWQIITLNPLLFLDFSQIELNHYKIYFFYNNRLYQIYQIFFQIENIHSLLFLNESTFLTMVSSQEKDNQYIFDKFGNINKIENFNNLEIYKEPYLVQSFRIPFYEIILNKVALCLLFVVNIILMILKIIYDYKREEKRREEKRREIYNPGGRAANNIGPKEKWLL